MSDSGKRDEWDRHNRGSPGPNAKRDVDALVDDPRAVEAHIAELRGE